MAVNTNTVNQSYLKLHVEAVIESEARTTAVQLKNAALPLAMIGLKKTRNAVCCIMSRLYPTFLKRLAVRLKRSQIIILNLYYQISIQFWIRNTLLQRFLQTDMVFFDQFNVPTVKFGKCFTEFIIPIALFTKLVC